MRTSLRSRAASIFLVGAALAIPFAAGAQSLPNPLGTNVTTVPQILGNVLRAMFGILGSIALLMFIYGGFLWLTSGGSPEQITKGKNTMVWAVLGVAVAFAASAIVQFVISAITGSS